MINSDNSDSSEVSSKCSYCFGVDGSDDEPGGGGGGGGGQDKPNTTLELGPDDFQKWETEFEKIPTNPLAINLVASRALIGIVLSRKRVEEIAEVFSQKLQKTGIPTTNQYSSGRCWIFAGLNVMRLPFMKKYNLWSFQFSQAHLYYWDKIEKCNYFLWTVVKLIQEGEKPDGRLLTFALTDPVDDGGNWNMAASLINKYGLMPQQCFPDNYHTKSPHEMNSLLKTKIRECTKILFDMHKANKSVDDMYKKIKEKMYEFHRIISICIGIPPKNFTWEYYSSGKYHSVGPITPLEFYEKHVKPIFNVDDKVNFMHDPRPENPFGKLYTSHVCIGCYVGAKSWTYNNQPMETLIDLIVKSLKNDHAVWFGCEVDKRFHSDLMVEDLKIHDYEKVFNMDFFITMNKVDRLTYRDSTPNHAMTFIGVHFDENGNPSKFQVENSWGTRDILMTREWLEEFVYQIIVDKSIVPEDLMKVFTMKPIIVPPWDPLMYLPR